MNATYYIRRWFDGPIGWARIVLLLIVGGGLATLAVAAIDDHIVTHQRETFQKVPCFMEASSISRESGRDDRNMPGWQYVPVVTFRYEVNGQTFTSHTVCSRTTPLTNKAAAEAFLFRFGPGASAECYVDPNDPNEAMLVLPANDQAKRFTTFGSLAVLLGLFALGVLQVALTFDTAPKRRGSRAPGWGDIDSGPRDALKRTRQMLKEKLES
jgi:hypothetical protein